MRLTLALLRIDWILNAHKINDSFSDYDTHEISEDTACTMCIYTQTCMKAKQKHKNKVIFKTTTNLKQTQELAIYKK